MRRLLVLLVAGVLLFAAVACGDDCVGPDEQAAPAGDDEGTTGEAACEPGTTVEARSERDLAYAEVAGVDPNLLSLDLDVPAHDACEPPPLVAFVHGGGWRQGDKDGAAIEEKRRLFTQAGYAFASVNHRLSPEPHDLTDAHRVAYPTHPQDVADALAFLDERAATLGVDTGRIGLVGHSAGAGIVSTLGTDTTFLEGAGLDPTSIACTASLDTEAYDVTEGAETPGTVGLTYQNAFSTDPSVWQEASPIEHVDGDEAPFLVVTRGTAKRVAMATDFVEQLERAGVDATLLVVTPYSHDDVNRLLGVDGEQTLTPEVTSFFEACLADR